MDKKSKLKAMANAIKHLEKSTKKAGMVYRLGDKPMNKVDVIPTGSLPLDIALGCGGWPRGRIIELFGAESSGKTLLASKAIAECQKQDGVCAMIDMEHAFDPYFAAKLGVDINDLFFSQPDHLQDCFTVIDNLVNAGCDLIILDSIATLVPQEELEGEVGKQTIGIIARYMGQFLRRIGPKLSQNNVCLICINQTRDNIGVLYGDPTTTPGGRALKFYSSVRVQVSRVSTLDVKDKQDNLIQRGIRCTVKKNKVGLPFKKAEFQVYLDGRECSKDLSDDIANIAINMGIIGRYDAAGNPSKTGRQYKFSYVDPETNEEFNLLAKKKDDVSVELKKLPKMQQHLLGIIKGEIDAPENMVPNEEMDSEMSDEDFENMMKDENYGNDFDEAEEIENFDDIL